jgi:hypothetical protein
MTLPTGAWFSWSDRADSASHPEGQRSAGVDMSEDRTKRPMSKTSARQANRNLIGVRFYPPREEE